MRSHGTASGKGKQTHFRCTLVHDFLNEKYDCTGNIIIFQKLFCHQQIEILYYLLKYHGILKVNLSSELCVYAMERKVTLL